MVQSRVRNHFRRGSSKIASVRRIRSYDTAAAPGSLVLYPHSRKVEIAIARPQGLFKVEYCRLIRLYNVIRLGFGYVRTVVCINLDLNWNKLTPPLGVSLHMRAFKGSALPETQKSG